MGGHRRVTLDNVQDLGNALCYLRQQEPDLNLISPMEGRCFQGFKHRHMPMYPLFIPSAHLACLHVPCHLDCCHQVSHLSPVPCRQLLLSPKEGREALLQAYEKELSSSITQLLQLWDFISLPCEEHKQVFGDVLPIIGFQVDPNLMRVRMSEESKLQLITAVRDFALHGTRHPLRDFQHITGHLNWALNAYPYLRPGLCALCAKTAGKLFQKAL